MDITPSRKNGFSITPKKTKASKGSNDPLEASFPSLLQTFFHRLLQKVYPVKSAGGGYCKAGV
jgi:hypothetical protein